MAEKRVLLLSWRPESLAALRGLGADVVCALTAQDDEKRAGLLDDAHTIPVRDPADTESVLAGLIRYGWSVTDFDVICTPSENPLVNAAVLGAGNSPTTLEDALLLRDKDLQKRSVREAGISVADSRLIVHARELEALPQPRGVLKPLDGTGTVGVLAWHSEEERIDLARRLGDEGARSPWLAEQWVEGHELHVDGVVRGGDVRFLSIGRYVQNLLEIRSGGIVASRVLHPDTHAGLYVRAQDFAQRAAKALRHHNGVFHMEVFEQQDQLVFGEYAGRIPGGDIASMIRLQFGVDLEEEWARAVLGLESAAAPLTVSACIGKVSLFTPAGLLESCPGEEELARRDGVRQVSMRARPGDVRPAPARAANTPTAVAIMEGRDEQQVVERLRKLAEWFAAQSVVRPETGGTRDGRELTRLSAPAGVVNR